MILTNEIAMVEEDLYISPTEVRVRYRFRNLSGTPVETLVAFPLPSRGFEFDFDWASIPFPHRDNYVGFTTWVEGIEIPLQVQNRALLLGVDVTARLSELGAPLIPFAEDVLDRIARLPATVQAALRDDLLVDDDGAPLWELETVLWRRQIFPAWRDLAVEHRYTPVRGGSASAPVGNFEGSVEPHEWSFDYAETARRQYCIEPKMERELNFRRLDGAAPGDRYYESSNVGYVLTTGANWAGPIGRFRLTVETPNARDSVFVCFEGAERVAPNQIVAERIDFWPEHDLQVLFLHLWGAEIERDD